MIQEGTGTIILNILMFRCAKIMKKRTKGEFPIIEGDQFGQCGE
jgi:hypothetical protein